MPKMKWWRLALPIGGWRLRSETAGRRLAATSPFLPSSTLSWSPLLVTCVVSAAFLLRLVLVLLLCSVEFRYVLFR
jgi:hypothetical protein